MANLVGSARTVENEAMRERVKSAIRRTAAEYMKKPGAEGQLARAALASPEYLVNAFIVRLSVTEGVVNTSCTHCGFADVPDVNITDLVYADWSAVAADEYPSEVSA